MIRKMNIEERSLIPSWAKSKGKVCPPSWADSDQGFIVHNGKKNLAAGYLITTNSGFCLCESIETNPESSHYTQSRAYIFFIQCMIDIAKVLGYQCIIGFVTPEKESSHRFYERLTGKVGQAYLGHCVEV